MMIEWRRTQGFSIHELVVILGVVSLMCVLLAPSLAGSESSAKTNNCRLNLGKIPLAAFAYANDHDGYTPPTLLEVMTKKWTRGVSLSGEFSIRRTGKSG
jgi:competence protein ComGC